MITDDDVKKLSNTFLTKKDAEKFATKEDLKRFATKEDLKRFATKEDLKKNNLDLRKDLAKHFITKPDLEFRLEQISTEIRVSKNEVLDRMDDVMGELKKRREDDVFHEAKHDRIEERLVKLESSK